jgi:hypothetical protein
MCKEVAVDLYGTSGGAEKTTKRQKRWSPGEKSKWLEQEEIFHTASQNSIRANGTLELSFMLADNE